MNLNDNDFSIYEGLTPNQIQMYLKRFKYDKAVRISKILVDLELLPLNYDHGAAIMADAFLKHREESG